MRDPARLDPNVKRADSRYFGDSFLIAYPRDQHLIWVLFRVESRLFELIEKPVVHLPELGLEV